MEDSTELPETKVADEDLIEELHPGGFLRAFESALRHRRDEPERIGEGGMGRVDLVRDQALARSVVMKRLHERYDDDVRALRRFIREAQITGYLEHPGIVPVHDIGLDDERRVYFTMKRVEGATLGAVIRALPEGPLARETLLDLLEVIVKVCDALAYAHTRGFIHLDIKPPNVMVGDFGQVYLLDWGIARRVATEEVGESSRGMVLVGTATYMAPEQARGDLGSLDARTDIFGIGGLLYHTIGRAVPYPAQTAIEAAAKAQSGIRSPLSELAPWAPPALVRIIDKAMAHAPGERYASALELRAELIAFMRGDGLFETVMFAKDELVVREGEPGDCAYIIETGSLEVSRGEDGRRRSLRIMGPGEVFGEMAVLSPGPRTATVVALEDSVLRRLTQETLASEIEGLKPWLGRLVRSMADRFRDTEARYSKRP